MRARFRKLAAWLIVISIGFYLLLEAPSSRTPATTPAKISNGEDARWAAPSDEPTTTEPAIAEVRATRSPNQSTAGEDSLPSLERYKRLIAPAVRAEALYEANQQCIGLPGLEGRDGLQDHMRHINARYFPREPGLWIAAGAWAQRLLDTTVAEEKRRVCVTFGTPPREEGVVTVYSTDR